MDFYHIGASASGAGGLTRYRSAPSAYFANILTSNSSTAGYGDHDFANLFNPRASSPDTQRIFTPFINSSADSGQENSPPSLPPRKKPTFADRPPRSDYSSRPMYSSRTSVLESSHNILPASIKKEEGEGSAGAGGTSRLVRQSSSPAGLFDSIHIDTRVEDGGRDHGGANMDNYIPEFPMSPWDDSTILSDDFIKGLTEDDSKTRFAKKIDWDDEKNEFGNGGRIPLCRHLSLPKSGLEDSIPCRVRAKRGFATHPRSIAERVRRNKISERTRKLQDIVPNMDKQTNTADMLDLAVDYIKDLQRQVKALSDNRAMCTCSIKMKP